MRRMAWILAALGLAGSTIQPIRSDDSYAWANGLKKPKAPVAKPASDEADEEEPSESDAKQNYYEELFGKPPLTEEISAESSTATGRASVLKTTTKTKADPARKPLGDVVWESSTGRHPTASAKTPKGGRPTLAPLPEDDIPVVEMDDFEELLAKKPARPKNAPIRQADAEKVDGTKDEVEPVEATRATPAAAKNPLRLSVSGSQRKSPAPRVEQAQGRSSASLTDEIPIEGETGEEESASDLPELDFSTPAAEETAIAEEIPAAPPARKSVARPRHEASLPDAEAALDNEADDSFEVDSHEAAAEAIAETPKAPSFPAARVQKLAAPNRAAVSKDITSRTHKSLTDVETLKPAVVQHPAIAASHSIVSAEQSQGVTVEWVKKSDITIGQECVCELVVKNHTDSEVADVEVETQVPGNVELISTDPQPASGSASLTWRMGSLGSGQSKAITIRMIPRQRGSIATQAMVRFSNLTTRTFNVSEPMLALELSGPNEVMVGETASQTVTIRNPGTGVAANVKVEARIPEGLEHSRGSRLVMDLGALNPGESRPVRLALAAVSGGRHVIEVKARADGDLIQAAATEISVIAPRITAGIEGPGLRYLGRQAVYTLTVSNDGAGNTDNVRIMHKIPEGFEFVSCEKGGRFDSSTRLLNWFVGPLSSGESAEAKVTLKATQSGEFTHFIRATADQGVVSDARASTHVEGAAALAMHVKDLDDPVETGIEAGYEIRITNEGSAAAEQVVLVCELPEGAVFSSATGPASHAAGGKTVSFQPIATIAPGETAKFQVFIRGQVAGNLRFRTKLTSASVNEPLTSEELTKFYDE